MAMEKSEEEDVITAFSPSPTNPYHRQQHFNMWRRLISPPSSICWLRWANARKWGRGKLFAAGGRVSAIGICMYVITNKKLVSQQKRENTHTQTKD
jgi:hypothetical protein